MSRSERDPSGAPRGRQGPPTGRIGSLLRGALADTRPLRHPEFRRLFLAGVVTVIGAQMSVVAVPAQIFQLTGSSAYVGLTGLFGLVPLLVFGLWGGAIADAVDRRTVLVVSSAGIGATTCALWAVSVGGGAAGVSGGSGSVWLVLGLFAAQQAFLAVNQPTRSAVLPRILPAGELAATNTLMFTVSMFGSVAGPLLAGALIPLVGLPTLYLLDSVALLAGLWAALRLPRLPPEPRADGVRRTAGTRDVLAGFRYLAGQRILLVSFLVDVVAMAFGMPRAVFPEMAERTFGDPPGGGIALGLLFASIAIGSVVAGLFSGWLERVRRQGVAVTVSICVWGLGVAAFGLVGSLWLAVLLLAVAGAADLISAVYRVTMLQVVATDEMRGRMQGAFFVVVAGGPRLADIWHGPTAAAVGPGTAATAGGIAVVVLTVVVVALLPEFWRYRAQ